MANRISTIAFRLLIFALSIQAASCTTYRRANRNEPPPASQHLPATQRPYTVNGTRYEPLSSHQGFAEEGIASSYGADFHGRRTSSGELFDMNAMSAAHKTLPLGVFVRVRHKRTEREIVVRINDRGPFVKERIIDLSEYAAAQLGILQEGTGPVRITALGYRSEGSNSYRQPMDYDSGSFALQVGAFTVRNNAIRYADELKKRYGSGEVQETARQGTTLYRVRTGRFTSLREAQAAQQQYDRAGYKGCFVVAVDSI